MEVTSDYYEIKTKNSSQSVYSHSSVGPSAFLYNLTLTLHRLYHNIYTLTSCNYYYCECLFVKKKTTQIVIN